MLFFATRGISRKLKQPFVVQATKIPGLLDRGADVRLLKLIKRDAKYRHGKISTTDVCVMWPSWLFVSAANFDLTISVRQRVFTNRQITKRQSGGVYAELHSARKSCALRSLLVTTADETVLKKNGSRFCKNAIGHRQQKSLLISAIVGSPAPT